LVALNQLNREYPSPDEHEIIEKLIVLLKEVMEPAPSLT
jgi:hypothetical protein